MGRLGGSIRVLETRDLSLWGSISVLEKVGLGLWGSRKELRLVWGLWDWFQGFGIRS